MYYENIAENEKYFRRFRFAIVLIIIAASIFVDAFFNGINELDDFSQEGGVVSEVHSDSRPPVQLVWRGLLKKKLQTLL